MRSDTLYCCAHDSEAKALLAFGIRPLILGVGKVRSAMSLWRFLWDAEQSGVRPRRICVMGVAGAFPSRHRPGPALDVGDLCIVERDGWIDEGVQTPDDFVSLEELGLEEQSWFDADPELSRRLSTTLRCPRVVGATVSTCSGSEELSRARASRGSYAVETMEGAALAYVSECAKIPWVCVRAISNRTGDRNAGGWDLPRACEVLREAVPILQQALGDL